MGIAAPARLHGKSSWLGLGELVRCRLCLRVTVAVFLSILVVEAAILIPSYYGYERDLLRRLEATGLAAISAGLGTAETPEAMLVAGARLVGRHNVAGAAIHGTDGALIGRFGTAPALRHGEAPRGRYGDRFDVFWPARANGLGVDIVACLDASQVGDELIAFVWRIAGLVLLISVFVAGVAIVLLGYLVLGPVLTLRATMRAARDDPANADGYKVHTTRRDELGESFTALNDLLDSVSQVRRDELKAREDRFRDFADSASDWFWEMDDRLRFSYFSPRYQAITGVPPAALLGKRREESGIAKLVDPETWRRHLDDLANHRPFRNFVHPRIQADGSTVWLSINGKPMFDSAGRFAGYRGSGTDITERVVHEAALKAASDEAQSANRAKSEFLTMMSHELRTPLNAIIGFSEVIRDQLFGPAAARYQEYAGDIHVSASHLLDLLNDILDLSKLEAGRVELNETECAIADTVEAALRLVRERAEQGGVSLFSEQLDELPVVVADERRLKQIFLNLLSNAVKFTPTGGRVRVTGRVQPADGAVSVTVQDTGIGIAKADLPRALAPFGQIDSELARRYEGTGLGLPLTRSLLELHNGTLRIDREVGEGTRVTLTLPPARVVEPPPARLAG